jgi:hypothetical protein
MLRLSNGPSSRPLTANERNDKKSLRRLQLMLQTALRPRIEKTNRHVVQARGSGMRWVLDLPETAAQLPGLHLRLAIQ